MKKIAYIIGMCLLFAIIGFFIGGFIGAYIGGNYMTDFQYRGMRGYEAVAPIGASAGAPAGLLFGLFLGVSKSRKWNR